MEENFKDYLLLTDYYEFSMANGYFFTEGYCRKTGNF
jgi:hypothetical protein